MSKTGTIRGLTFGDGTTYPIVGPISGLGGIPATRAADAERGDRHGLVAGTEPLGKRMLSIPLGVESRDDIPDLWARRTALMSAWSPSDTDIELSLSVPGLPVGGLTFYGRPRAPEADLAFIDDGWMDVLATFEALDPLGYGAEDASAGNTGTFSIDNVGTAPTDRVQLVINGDGGAPRIASSTDDGAAIAFAAAVSGSVTIDLRGRTVTDGSTDRYGDLSISSRWFELFPGPNELTLTGATSVDVIWRPAWY